MDSKPWGFFLYLLLCQFYAWISVVFSETNSQTNLLPIQYKLTYIRHMLFASQIYTIWSIWIKPKTIRYLVYIKCFGYNSACAGAFKFIVNLKVWLFLFWLSIWKKRCTRSGVVLCEGPPGVDLLVYEACICCPWTPSQRVILHTALHETVKEMPYSVYLTYSCRHLKRSGIDSGYYISLTCQPLNVSHYWLQYASVLWREKKILCARGVLLGSVVLLSVV